MKAHIWSLVLIKSLFVFLDLIRFDEVYISFFGCGTKEIYWFNSRLSNL